MSHAKYAPSAAHRWINCPASLNSWTGEEGESSQAAEEGTAAHELFTHCMESGIDPMDQHLEGAVYNGFAVTYEMAETIGSVVAALHKRIEKEGPEAEVTFAEVIHIVDVHKTDCWGELDFSIYNPSTKHLYIMDLKYGAGTFVAAKENWQMLLYASGKVRELELLGDEVAKITLCISQPRHPEHRYLFDMWEIDRESLKPFQQRARAATEDKTTLKAGSWCKFCPNKLGCETHVAYIAEALPDNAAEPAQFRETANALTMEQIKIVLDRESAVKSWFAMVRDHAQALIKLGGKATEDALGYRITETIGHRKWKDKQEAEKELRAAFGDVIYEPLELRSPAQMEKIKGAKDIVKKHTHRPITGETLEKIE